MDEYYSPDDHPSSALGFTLRRSRGREIIRGVDEYMYCSSYATCVGADLHSSYGQRLDMLPSGRPFGSFSSGSLGRRLWPVHRPPRKQHHRRPRHTSTQAIVSGQHSATRHAAASITIRACLVALSLSLSLSSLSAFPLAAAWRGPGLGVG